MTTRVNPWEELTRGLPVTAGKFKPGSLYIEPLDLLVILEEDCSHVSRHLPESNISILYDSNDQARVVGVEIWNASAVMRQVPKPYSRFAADRRAHIPEGYEAPLDPTPIRMQIGIPTARTTEKKKED